MKTEKFEPKIIAFICNWCAYGAADLAGVSRMQYPPNVRAVRVMCSATVSPHYILRALQDGADGVLVGGWHIGDCHYLYGNHMTIKRITFLQELLAFMGLEGRLHLEWISSAEARKFVRVITVFTEKIRTLGPNPLSGYSEFAKAAGLEAAADSGRNKLPDKNTGRVYNLDDSASHRVRRTQREKSKNSVVSTVSAIVKGNAQGSREN